MTLTTTQGKALVQLTAAGMKPCTGCPFLACGPCPYQGGPSAWVCQVCQQPAPKGDPVCTKCGDPAGQGVITPMTLGTEGLICYEHHN